jgi:hypothetical protein
MKATLFIGMLIGIAGLFFLIQGGFSYKQNEKVVDVGPLHASADVQKHVDVPPLAAWGMLVGGVVLVGVGMRRKP